MIHQFIDGLWMFMMSGSPKWIAFSEWWFSYMVNYQKWSRSSFCRSHALARDSTKKWCARNSSWPIRTSRVITRPGWVDKSWLAWRAPTCSCERTCFGAKLMADRGLRPTSEATCVWIMDKHPMILDCVNLGEGFMGNLSRRVQIWGNMSYPDIWGNMLQIFAV